MKPLTLDEIEAIKETARETFAKVQAEREQYKQIIDMMQPLLATLAEALYGENRDDVMLDVLISDSINYLNGNKDGVSH